MSLTDLIRALITTLLIGFPATSALASGSGWYGGLSIGQSRSKINDARINNELLAAGFAGPVTAKDHTDAAYKMFGGYRFGPRLAVEGGYFDLGSAGYTSTTAAPAGTLTGTLKRQGINLDTVGTLPLSDRWAAFGRLGAHVTEAKDTFAGTGGVNVINPGATKREANVKVGLGIQYDFSRAIALRGELERYRVQDAYGNRGDIDVYSAGLLFKF